MGRTPQSGSLVAYIPLISVVLSPSPLSRHGPCVVVAGGGVRPGALGVLGARQGPPEGPRRCCHRRSSGAEARRPRGRRRRRPGDGRDSPRALEGGWRWREARGGAPQEGRPQGREGRQKEELRRQGGAGQGGLGSPPVRLQEVQRPQEEAPRRGREVRRAPQGREGPQGSQVRREGWTQEGAQDQRLPQQVPQGRVPQGAQVLRRLPQGRPPQEARRLPRPPREEGGPPQEGRPPQVGLRRGPQGQEGPRGQGPLRRRAQGRQGLQGPRGAPRAQGAVRQEGRQGGRQEVGLQEGPPLSASRGARGAHPADSDNAGPGQCEPATQPRAQTCLTSGHTRLC